VDYDFLSFLVVSAKLIL